VVIYVILWIFIIFCAMISKINRLHPKYFLISSFGAMSLVVGLRGVSVGEDTSMYFRVAQSAMNTRWSDIISSFPNTQWNYISYGSYGGYVEKIETLYMLYNKLIMMIFHNPQWVLFITAIITNILMARFIYKNVSDRKDIYFASYIYLCDTFFMSSFNMMRQILAISIAVQSINDVKNQKYKKAVLWIILASLIHQSSLLFGLVYALYIIRNKKKNYKFLLFGTCILPILLPKLISIISRISLKYASYLQVSFWSAQARGVIILWGIIVAIVIVAIKSQKSTNYDWWLIYMATLYIGVELIGMKLTVISRVALYFRIGLVLLLPEAKKYFDKKNKIVYLLITLFVVTMSYFSYANSAARIYVLGNL